MSSRFDMRRAARAISLNLALVFASVLFAVLIGEMMVRIFAPQQLIQIRPDLWQPADSLGWAHQRGTDIRINTGEGWVNVRTDRDGFRIGERGRIEGGVPVLLLGDSFMEAIQVEHEESFAGLLEAELPERIGMPISVRNTGVSAWEPGQYLIQAHRTLPTERFGLVVVAIFLGNDIVDGRTTYWPPRAPVERHSFGIPRGLNRRELLARVLLPLNETLETHSHLFVLFRNNLETLRMRLGLHPLAFPPEFLRAEAETSRWQNTARIAANIDSLATAYRAPALFVLIPASFQIDPASFAHYVAGYGIDPDSVDLEQPNRIMRALLEERGLRVLDVLPAFRTAHERGDRLYGTVDPHLSPTGHRVLADAVMPVAAELVRPRSLGVVQ